MKHFRAKDGITILEIIVVVAIIAVLVQLAVPRYHKFIARARETEAKIALGTMRSFQETYFLEFNQYARVSHFGKLPTLPGHDCTSNFAAPLGFGFENCGVGELPRYRYHGGPDTLTGLPDNPDPANQWFMEARSGKCEQNLIVRGCCLADFWAMSSTGRLVQLACARCNCPY